MPICISCSTPVPSLYTTYSKADDRSLGKGVRLTQCPKCKRFADKYVEHDFVVLFIDLVLIKPQVYRHLLFNRLSTSSRSPNKFEPSILRLGILLILFDVYLTWAHVERSSLSASALNDAPILTQYIFFLTLNLIATMAQHFVVRNIVQHFLSVPTPHLIASPLLASNSSNGSPGKDSMAGSTSSPSSAMVAPGRATPAAISTALLVSSCMKLFPILLVIWPTSTRPEDGAEEQASTNATFTSRASSYVGWAVLVNNIEALLILLDCGYPVATGLAVAGAMARYAVEKMILGMVGLNGDAHSGIRNAVGKFGDLVGLR